MYAMQYRIGLPSDYDMEIIRNRVRRTGHLMDGFPGLEFKAYLLQEKANGAPSNAYAPFYVWRDLDGMRAFCWGEPGYSAIVRDFGRQPIQDWTLHRLVTGPGDHREARSLTLTTVPLPADEAPSRCVGSAADPFLDGAGEHTVYRVAAVDVTSWNLILVDLSTTPATPGQPGQDTYEVLHVSPGAAAPARP